MADDPSVPTVFGWDASDYDWARGPMDLAAARADGIDFFTHKATEGVATKHVNYGEAMRRARDAGIPVLGSYHVVRSTSGPARQVDYWLSYVDSATPWWRDWPSWFWQVDLEAWPYDSVPASYGEAVADIIEQRTGRKAIIYASRGQYGDQLATSSHDLWNANYGSNYTDHYRDVYGWRGGDSGPGWTAYSGRTPVFWQYGSRVTIGAQTICDANAFRGTVDQLKAMITGVDEMSEWSEPDPGGPDPDGVNRRPWQKQRDQHAAVYFGTRPVDKDGKPVGPEPWIVSTGNKLLAAAASDETRDKAMLAMIEALVAGGTSVDTAAVIAAARAEGEATRELVEQRHQAEMAELRQLHAAEVAGLQAELDALKGATPA